MYKEIIDKLKKYQKIVIHRHIRPDLDALGSQLGLKGIIEDNFPEIDVRVVGDENELTFLGTMDRVDDDFYQDALAISVDVAVKDLVSDQRYQLAKEVMIIDHHLNQNDFGDHWYSFSEHIAVCQILTDMVMKEKLKISKDTAHKLLSGIISDSGRFLYPSVSALTFKAVAFLLEAGADLQSLYQNMYKENMNHIKLKGYFINHFKTTKNNVAYMKNNKELKEEFNVSTFAVSRGMVNQMAGIDNVPIWVNFTEDDDNSILCEIRSKEIPVISVARKYGGGGHQLACGCTLKSWDHVDHVLNDLDELIERR